MAAKVAKLPETREANLVSNETTGSIQTRRDNPLEGWVLRSVGAGRAIIEGRGALFQVVPGSQIPGVGIVQEITQKQGRWVVVTTAGVIGLPPNIRTQF